MSIAERRKIGLDSVLSRVLAIRAMMNFIGSAKTAWKAVLLGFCLLPLGAVAAEKTASRADFVDLRSHIPGIVVATPYATNANFLKRAVYPRNQVFLRRSVADRLALVQADLKAAGFELKVLDGFRPLSIQREMWRLKPDSRFVANPARGSRHNRGAAVDVTLVDAAGKELEMPTAFDDFTGAAHVSARPKNATAGENRKRLQNAMIRRGFKPLATEWWHFDAPDWKEFPIADALPGQR